MTRHFVYIVVEKGTRKLLREEVFDTKLAAEQNSYFLRRDDKVEIVELRLFK